MVGWIGSQTLLNWDQDAALVHEAGAKLRFWRTNYLASPLGYTYHAVYTYIPYHTPTVEEVGFCGRGAGVATRTGVVV